jgi:HEAT repeat protein
MTRAAPLLVAGIAAAYFAAFVHYGILLEDEGLILLQIARTFRGAHPYVDFHTGYSPGGFYLNALLFRLFGESVVPLRVVLVGVNAASTAMIFVLARRVAGTALAAAVALGWMAHLPVFVGLFASFNVPYPSWYGICASLATQLAFDRHLATGRRAPLVAAGLAAGIAFSIKQNVGSLAGLSCGLVLALLHAGVGDPDRRLARLLLVLAAVFLLAGFTVAVTTVEAVFILGPTLVLIAGRLAWARALLPAPIRLVPGVALVAAGLIVVSGLWLVPFVAVLGVRGLMREIFLVGTDFDLVYATPYPIPFAFPDAWPVIGTLGLVVLALGGLGAARGRIGSRTATAVVVTTVAGCSAMVARWSRMPEGFARSVTLQAQHLGFFAAPVLGLAVAVAWLRRVRHEPASTPDARMLAMLVFALCAFAGLYPRIDETHLLIVLPSSLVLAAWAARRLAEAWSEAVRISPRRLADAMATCGILLALVAAVPSFRAHAALRDGRLERHARVLVDSPAAPVHLDGPHAADTRALNAMLAWLRERLEPGEALFHFPCVALVPYLLGHPSLSRHDYWYAGRPDHLEEAEVVRQLATVRPRFALTVNRNLGFFSNSARYYFLLRQFLREHYTVAARFGRYDVLVRRDLATAPPHVEDFVDPVGDDLIARLAEPLYGARLAAIRAFLERARTSADVADLAARIAPDDRSRLLLLRGMAEVPDVRTVPFVASEFESEAWRVRSEAAITLNYVALYTAEHRYVPGKLPGERDPAPADLVGLVAPERARRWLRDKGSRQAAAFAAWVLAASNDTESAPVLRDVVDTSEKNPYLRLVAVYGLMRGGGPEQLCALVDLVGDKRHEYQDAVPSLLLDEAAQHPASLAACLRRSLADARARAREMSAWIAGAAGLRDVAPTLRGALGDPERRVRIGAAWALGRLADVEARPALTQMVGEPDEQIRAFAAEALARLDAGGP